MLSICAIGIFFIISRNNHNQTIPIERTGNPGKVEWVNPNGVHPGQIRHSELTDTQVNRIRALQAHLGKYDGLTLDQWIDNFKRDANPDRELAVWDAISGAMRMTEEKMALTQDQSREAFKVVLMSSMAPYEQARPKMTLVLLSEQQVKEIYSYFTKFYNP